MTRKNCVCLLVVVFGVFAFANFPIRAVFGRPNLVATWPTPATIPTSVFDDNATPVPNNSGQQSTVVPTSALPQSNQPGSQNQGQPQPTPRRYVPKATNVSTSVPPPTATSTQYVPPHSDAKSGEGVNFQTYCAQKFGAVEYKQEGNALGFGCQKGTLIFMLEYDQVCLEVWGTERPVMVAGNVTEQGSLKCQSSGGGGLETTLKTAESDVTATATATLDPTNETVKATTAPCEQVAQGGTTFILGDQVTPEKLRWCTEYVAERYPKLIQCWAKNGYPYRNAEAWDDIARKIADKCGKVSPREVGGWQSTDWLEIQPGDVVVWDSKCMKRDARGHVGIVVSVALDPVDYPKSYGPVRAKIVVDQSNAKGDLKYSRDTADVNANCMSFIHVPDSLKEKAR